VAVEYKKLILSLGVDISLSKSVTPYGETNSAEFASKLIVKGKNLSPLPLGLLIVNDYQRVLTFWKLLYIKSSELGVPNLVWTALEATASAPGKVQSRVIKIRSSDPLLKSKDFNNDDFCTILGILLGLNLYKRSGPRLGKSIIYGDRGEPLNLINDPLLLYLEGVPLAFWSDLSKGLETVTSRQLRQAIIVIRSGYLNNEKLKGSWIGIIKPSVVEDLFLRRNEEFWILAISPFIRSYTEIAESFFNDTAK